MMEFVRRSPAGARGFKPMLAGRAGLLAGLVMAEALILGAMVYAAGGLHGPIGIMHLQQIEGSATARVLPAIDAGSAPEIVVDDPSSRVIITASSDGRVHMTDDWNVHGFTWGRQRTLPQLKAERSANGVTITRAAYAGGFAGFGSMQEHTLIALPPAARINVREASGIDLSGNQGSVTMHSQDGHIDLTDTRAPIDIRSDDGSLHLTNVTTNRLNATTADGRITAKNVTLSGDRPSATLHSDNGSVHFFGTLAPDGTYVMNSNDGRIEVSLASADGIRIAARTQDGRIEVNHVRMHNDDGGDAVTLNSSATRGSLELASQNGSITLIAPGAQH